MESSVIAKIYESRLWRRNPLFSFLLGISFDRELTLVLDSLRVRPGERVLDLGCGPGIYARPLARAADPGCAIGIDISRPMLRHASQLASRDETSNLVLVRASAMQLPIGDGRVNVASCCGALHLFPDATRALAEIHRVLAPAGRLCIAAFRQRGGRLSERVTQLRRARTGMDAYSVEQLEGRLREAGFGEIRCHHARGIWLVVGASKAG